MHRRSKFQTIADPRAKHYVLFAMAKWAGQFRTIGQINFVGADGVEVECLSDLPMRLDGRCVVVYEHASVEGDVERRMLFLRNKLPDEVCATQLRVASWQDGIIIRFFFFFFWIGALSDC